MEAEKKEEEVDVIEGESPVVLLEKKTSTWAKLIAKVYEVDPLVCTKCGGEMKVVAVIMDFFLNYNIMCLFL